MRWRFGRIARNWRWSVTRHSQRLAESGRLQQIYEKWGIWNADQRMLFGDEPTSDGLRTTRGNGRLPTISRCCCAGHW